MSKKPYLEWSEEIDARLVKLRRDDHAKWEVIATELGSSRTAVQRRYALLVPIEQRVVIVRRRTWSADDEAQLYKLRYDDLKKITEISRIMKRSAVSLRSKLDKMGRPERNRVHIERPPKLVVPQRCIEERDNRMATKPRDLSAHFFGDPKPGYSALDRA